MTAIKSLTALIFAALLGGLVGCAGTETSASTGQYIDDRALTAKVKTALVRDDEVKAREINVETFKGTVQLTGFVDSREQVRRAEEIARDIEGVRTVQNDLRLKRDADY